MNVNFVDNPLGYEGLYHLKQAIKGPSMPHLETLNLSGMPTQFKRFFFKY